jgi:hypothetical protein
MRPIFTIHAGEYLVATRIEESFPHLRIWIPSSDTGIDLLVTDAHQNKVASLQVKFSKDHIGTKEATSPEILSVGWWTLNRKKIAASTADLWVFVLYQFHTRRFDFVVISPSDLLSRFDALGVRTDTIQTYFSVTKHARCWQTRGLSKGDEVKVCSGEYENTDRDFTKNLNRWPFVGAGA